ncbi:NYN domain-containing protein [Rhodothermus profundi]|uniref:NYN domain-containing protein n=1 Tax=Rhodothermus profundi TaxID=633813 RepID=A0A1M6PDW7_9BACT|nr:NYN domain-containing protein [Rhodothermus profundi]SHK06158.1 NYN domain-containing protein [Rhodothermus profundi]
MDRLHSRKPIRTTALFVDYENLYRQTVRYLKEEESINGQLADLLYSLRRYLLARRRFRVVLGRAYADFEQYEDGLAIQRVLAEQGIVPCMVPASLDPPARSLQLTIDALHTLQSHPEVQAFVVVSGDLAYLPLLEYLRSHGRQVALLQLAPPSDLVYERLGDRLLLDPRPILEHAGLRRLLTHLSGSTIESTAAPPPVFASLADDPAALRALELIVEHFGRYDEVYLTPLLRKMSETFDASEVEPKELINRLEAAGAIRLERRRGFPYDYTVLILHEDHPDVRRIRETLAATSDFETDTSGDLSEKDHVEDPSGEEPSAF